MPSCISVSVCLLAAAATCTAVEVADLRFGLGVAPMPDESSGTWTATGSTTPVSDVTTFAGRAGLGFTVSGTIGTLEPVGLLFGAEGRYSVGEAGINSETVNGVSIDLSTIPESTYTEADAVLHAGVGWAITERAHFELLGLIGLAYVTIDSPANIFTSNQSTQQGQGNGTIVGARGGWYYTFESRWQLGLEAEWTRTSADITTNYIDGHLNTTIETAGASARAVLGYRF